MSETITLQQGVPGGRYWDIGSQRYINSVGEPLDPTEVLPNLLAQKSALESKIAQVEAMKEAKSEESGVIAPQEDVPPSDYQGKKKWVKSHGKEVVFNISSEKLDALIEEIKGQ